MVLYDNLPVYKASYDLFQDITVLRHQMKREYKFTIGERLLSETIEQQAEQNQQQQKTIEQQQELLKKLESRIEALEKK